MNFRFSDGGVHDVGRPETHKNVIELVTMDERGFVRGDFDVVSVDEIVPENEVMIRLVSERNADGRRGLLGKQGGAEGQERRQRGR